MAQRYRRWVIATAAAIATVAGATRLLRPGWTPRIAAVRPLTGNLSLHPPGHFRGMPSWATDGDRVYYLSLRGELMVLHSAPAGGGDSVEIPLPFDWERGIFGYLPKESALLMRGADRPINDSTEGGAPLWIVSVPGGGARRLSNLIASQAEISPDGSKLALLRWDKLAVARIDGSDERALHTLRSPSPSDLPRHQIRWTPDGQRLRFMDAGLPGTERGTWIWEIAIGGGPARPLWPGEGGAWTPDGRYFLLSQWDERHLRRDISLAPENHWLWRRPQPKRLTVGPLDLTNVGSSRDGRHLFAFGTTPRGELLRLDSKAQRFEPFLGGESAFYTEPSPDGKWLAWVRYPEGTLWKSRPDGSERMQLTSPPLEVHLPRWSPDGKRLVFAARTPTDRPLSIQMVAADGGALEEVARSETEVLSYWDPCWMPDGSIVFSHLFSLHPGLFRFDPATRGIATIPGSDALLYPKCSRQGDLLAWFLAATGRSYRVLRTGHRIWQDLGPLSGLLYASWTRGGDSFCGLTEPATRVQCFSLATQRLEPLAEDHELSLKSWVGGPWMGLDANDMPLVVADRSTTALYSLDWEAP